MKQISSWASFGGKLPAHEHASDVCQCPMTFALYTPPQASQGAVSMLWNLSGLTCDWSNVMEKPGIQRAAAAVRTRCCRHAASLYADARCARLGVNDKQILVNRPQAPVHSYSKDGAMRTENVADPVYASNSYGGSKADPTRIDEAGLWYADGDVIRKAYTLRREDDDFGQARTQVPEALDAAARDRLVDNAVGHLTAGDSAPVLERALEY